MWRILEKLETLAEGYIFDPSFIDLVVWFPHLSWSELVASAGVVITWKLVTDRIERALTRRLRAMLARGLFAAACVLRP